MSHFFESKQTFYINSSNRINGTDSDFYIELAIDPHADYNQCCLLSCSIPKSYYAVQEGYNSFTIIEDSTPRVITMIKGNYSRNSFASSLKDLLNTDQPTGWVYDITFQNISRSVDDGKYTFSITGNSGIQPIIMIGDFLGEQMGFLSNSSNVFVNGSIRSVNVCNLNPENTLIIHSDIISNGHNSHLKSIASSVTNSFDYIIYNETNIEASSKMISRSKSNVYRFMLTNENNILLDLNGQNIVFVLLLYKFISTRNIKEDTKIN